MEIDGAVERFHDGTREWAFADFDEWSQNQSHSRVFVLSGDAGMGKTGIMSKLARFRTDTILAHHFCRHDDKEKSTPAALLKSLAAMLFRRVDGFASSLQAVDAKTRNEALASLDPKLVFETLLAAPLAKVQSPSKALLLIIDALDEIPKEGQKPVC